MKAIFNEYSAEQLANISKEQAFNMMRELIQVCKQLQAIESNFTMRIQETFWDIQLDGYGTIRELTYSEDLEDTERAILYSATQSPYLDADVEDDKFLVENMEFDNKAVSADSGMRAAYASCPQPVPIISFGTDAAFTKDFIEIFVDQKPIKLMNIASVKQLFDVHFEHIVLDHTTWTIPNPTTAKVKDILPNKDISNLYLEYYQFYIKRNGGHSLNGTIPVTQRKKIGSVVASVNGWKKHSLYSEINKRFVFEHIKKKTIFVAIDTEKADFEVHQSNKGEHLGAISFDGEKVEPPKKHKLRFEFE